jgi:7-keto-8-aminopelargonate synthetase-like enzyme
MGSIGADAPLPATRPSTWLDRLRDRLRHEAEQGRRRHARVVPTGLHDFSTNDALGLRRHPRLVHASCEAARAHGVGAGASRLVGGESALLRDVEHAFARFKGAPDARLLPTGFHANLAAIGALASEGDLLLLDKRCHASLIDAARLARASRPLTIRTFPHADLARAESIAARWLERSENAAVWLVAESVYSMDGDVADLPALAALRDRLAAKAPAGAALILDEAHATGVLGPGAAGLDAAHGHLADVVISTVSKALGGLGGLVTGPPEVIAAIDHFARAFIYTTGATPPQAAVIAAALDVLRDEPERQSLLADRIRRVRAALRAAGWPVETAETHPTTIIPLVVPSSEDALALAARLSNAGIHAPAIRPPTVPRNAPRVRISLSLAQPEEAVDRLLTLLAEEKPSRPR